MFAPLWEWHSVFLAGESWPFGLETPFLIGCLSSPRLLLRPSLAETKVFQPAQIPHRFPDFRLTCGNEQSSSWACAFPHDHVFFMPHGLYSHVWSRGIALHGSGELDGHTCLGHVELHWLPWRAILTDLGGDSTDRFTLATLATAYPAMMWLVSSPSIARLRS